MQHIFWKLPVFQWMKSQLVLVMPILRHFGVFFGVLLATHHEVDVCKVQSFIKTIDT